MPYSPDATDTQARVQPCEGRIFHLVAPVKHLPGRVGLGPQGGPLEEELLSEQSGSFWSPGQRGMTNNLNFLPAIQAP